MKVRFVVELEDAVREPVLFRITVIQQLHDVIPIAIRKSVNQSQS